MVLEAPVALAVVIIEIYCIFREFISTKLKTDPRVCRGTHNFDERESHMADLIVVTSSKMRLLVVQSA